jgi:hypothetical protein
MEGRVGDAIIDLPATARIRISPARNLNLPWWCHRVAVSISRD